MVLSMELETLKDFSDSRVIIQCRNHARYLKDFNLWITHVEKREIKYEPMVMLIGSDHNDDPEMVKS